MSVITIKRDALRTLFSIKLKLPVFIFPKRLTIHTSGPRDISYGNDILYIEDIKYSFGTDLAGKFLEMFHA